MNKTMRGSVVQLALAPLLALVFVVGCQRVVAHGTSISFESFCGLTHQQFAEMDEGQVRQWLTARAGLGATDRPQPAGAPEDEKVIDAQGTTVFLRAGRLYRILQPLRDGPTLGQVVATFGPPPMIDRYTPLPRHPELVLYTLGLDYPQVGISVASSGQSSMKELERDGQLAVQLQEDLKVSLVECYQPAGSMEEVRRAMFPAAPDTVAAQLKALLPWPGFGSWVPLE